MLGDPPPEEADDGVAHVAFVAWLRASPWREPLLAASFFLAVAYVAFGANVFAGDVVAPMDLLSRFSGYTENGTPRPLVNVEMGDVLDSVLPIFRYAKRELSRGQLPLWNPLPAGGEPGLPLVFNGLVSPRFFFFLLLPDGLGYTLGLIVQLALAGLGTHLLCRPGTGILPAAFAGVTFMLSGFNSSWTQWSQVSTSIWIPWMLWALGRLDRDASRRRVATLAAIVALLLFGGFPSVAGYGFYFAGTLGLILFASRLRRLGARPAVEFGAAAFSAVGLGVLLTAVQLVPSLYYLREFDLGARALHATGLPADALRALVDPDSIETQWTERTAYVGILPLVLSGIALVLLAIRKSQRAQPPLLSPMVWLGLLGFALCATYSTPASVASLLYRLPVLNFNPSGRMSSVMALAFAVLSGVATEALLTLSRPCLRRHVGASFSRIAPAVAIAGLIAVQVRDEGRTLPRHNAHAGKAWFFPVHPTVRYVLDHLGPDQSVLAVTDAYMLPGTLGSYGIPEWFGHAFRRPAERVALERVVREPWAPGTSARVAFDHIALQEPVLDRLGIRFILLASAANPLEHLRTPILAQPRADTPVPLEEAAEELTVGQTFTVREAATACAVRLRFGTYRAAHAGADVHLLLTGPNGVSAAATLPAAEITDNAWAEFALPRLSLSPGDYSLRLGLLGDLPARVAVWSSRLDGSFPDGARLASHATAPGDLTFELYGCDPDRAGGFRIAHSNEHLLVLENTEATSGAFLVAKDAPADAALAPGTVRLLDYTASERRYEVNTPTAALLVRAARFWPGFRATVDGTPARVSSYASLFQATPVPAGTHVVNIRYFPEGGWLGGVLSGLGLGLFVLLLLPGRWLSAKP
jgi:hypothetical protein